MIVIRGDVMEGAFPETYAYCDGWNLLTRRVLPVTRWLRAVHTEKYMNFPIERHLDIGCGDGYFLKRSKARERYGIDHLLGDDVRDVSRFPSNFFDCITMLAVVEHLKDPSVLHTHILPALKPQGRLIMTTPKKSAEALIRLYLPDVKEKHEIYFDRDSMMQAAGSGYRLLGFHTFICGLNQAFCLEKL